MTAGLTPGLKLNIFNVLFVVLFSLMITDPLKGLNLLDTQGYPKRRMIFIASVQLWLWNFKYAARLECSFTGLTWDLAQVVPWPFLSTTTCRKLLSDLQGQSYDQFCSATKN